MMTFQEAYGSLPMRLWRAYRYANVSPADHDRILNRFGHVWSDDIPAETWDAILTFVKSNIQDGRLYLPRYM